MSDSIPTEAKEQIAEFLKQQAEEEARRQSAKANNLSKKVRNDIRFPERPMTPSEVESYAKRFGLTIETGNGRHGKHLIAPDNRRMPLPDHGGLRTLAKGTQHSIVNFIREHGVDRRQQSNPLNAPAK